MNQETGWTVFSLNAPDPLTQKSNCLPVSEYTISKQYQTTLKQVLLGVDSVLSELDLK